MNQTYVLIMAGGEGERLAPLSTPERPKQFLNIVGKGSFLEQTRKRIGGIVPADCIFVATNERYGQLIREQLPDIPALNIILEPSKKNTAPCIAYAAKLIQEKNPQATMVILPSDHVIDREDLFVQIVRQGIGLAQEGVRLVTLGIKPSWPAPCYGYIKAGGPDKNGSASFFEVEKFVEKPDESIAAQYLADGAYYWNSGIFVWSVNAIMNEFSEHLPEIRRQIDGFKPGDSFRRYFFQNVQSISIDYGIMEKSKNVSVIPFNADWSDVGSWEGLYDLHRKNGVVIQPGAFEIMRNQLGYLSPAGTSLHTRIAKPWGHEEIWAHTEDYVGKFISINKGEQLSYQYHRIKEETIRVVEGVMELEYEDNGQRHIARLSPGDFHHIPPRMKHRFRAVENCRLIEVSTPWLNDVVRLEDDYGRENKKGPSSI